MRNIVILTKDASQITAGEKNAPAAVMALKTRFFAEMRRDGVDDDIGADETCSSLLEAVDAAKTGTEVAIGQMRIRLRPLLGFLDGCEKLVLWQVIVQQIRR